MVRRLRTVSGNLKSFQATATADCAIQELGLEARKNLDMLEERGWIAWFDLDADIHEGDKLTDQDGVQYSVREITKKDYGINQHLEVIMEEFNA